MARRNTKTRAVRRTGCVVKIQGARGTSYRLKFDQPTGIKGERKTIYKTMRGVSRDEAEAELAKLMEKVGKGVDAHAGRQTLAEWIETWLDVHPPDVSQRTFERYAELLRNHVIPEIGHHPLAILSPLHIERLYRQLEKRLAHRTVTHCHRILFQCLKDARRLRVIADNPAQDTRRRRNKNSQKGTGAEMHVLPLEGLFDLFEHARSARFRNCPYELILLAFDSGGRRGELLGLRWSDLDKEKRTIKIDRAVDETRAFGVRIKPELKNEKSRRTVTLSGQTIAALSDLWKRQAEDLLLLGARLPDDALIFPNSIEQPSKPMRPREVTKSFGRVVHRAGLDGFRFHDLRHSCASHMLKAGRTVPEVSKHLGHANSAITLSVYSHAIPKADGEIGLLDELMPTAAE